MEGDVGVIALLSEGGNSSFHPSSSSSSHLLGKWEILMSWKVNDGTVSRTSQMLLIAQVRRGLKLTIGLESDTQTAM